MLIPILCLFFDDSLRTLWLFNRAVHATWHPTTLTTSRMQHSSRSTRSPRDTTYASIFPLRLKNHYSLVIDTNRAQVKRSTCHSSIATPYPWILICASWSILWNSNKISIWSEFRIPTSKSSLTRCWRYTLKQSESDARFSETYRIK